jgi:hypothetical protein
LLLTFWLLPLVQLIEPSFDAQQSHHQSTSKSLSFSLQFHPVTYQSFITLSAYVLQQSFSFFEHALRQLSFTILL